MSDFHSEREEDLSHLEEDQLHNEMAVHDVDGDSAQDDGEQAEAPSGQPRSRADRGKPGPENLPQPLYRVKASHSHETYFAWREGGEALEPGTIVIAPTRYGKDLCLVQGLVESP
ncbi:MAG: hypothetical protein WCL50_06115, partial [Spirochaetota bacterium]